MGNLTARKVATLSEPGFYGDGEGLHLKVGKGGAKSWILRTLVHGRRRDLGLGSASLISLAEAREEARKLRKIARQGGNPDDVRKKSHLSFREAAEQVHANLLPTWKNKKHAAQWITTVETHAYPKLARRPLESVGTADILEILTPIWTEKHETAKRLKQRLSTIFDWAKGAGHYPHENPVNGVSRALPPVKVKAKHMASLPWAELPALMRDLRGREGISARTLEFIILTASRSQEAREARWSEIRGNVWEIPAERMKAGQPHRVPLNDQAIAVLEQVRGLDADLVFPSRSTAKSGASRPQSVMVFKALFKRMGVEGITTHGFRSTFRDWCSESAKADRELAELSLAHAVGNKVERAYARSDLFERRRDLMDAWGRYASGETGEVVELVRI